MKVFETGTKSRPFPHALVVGLDRHPRSVSRTMSKTKILKRTAMKPFTKYVNLQHVMPTRYATDMDVKSVVTVPGVKGEKKSPTHVEVKKMFEDRYLSGTKPGSGSAWFFEKLRF